MALLLIQGENSGLSGAAMSLPWTTTSFKQYITPGRRISISERRQALVPSHKECDKNRKPHHRCQGRSVVKLGYLIVSAGQINGGKNSGNFKSLTATITVSFASLQLTHGWILPDFFCMTTTDAVEAFNYASIQQMAQLL